MTYWHSTLVMARQVFRKRGFLIVSALLPFLSLAMFSLYYGRCDYVGMLHFSHFAIAGYMLLMLMFGLSLGHLEKEEGFEDVLRVSARGIRLRAGGKLIFCCMAALGFTLAIAAEVCALYLLMRAEPALYVYALRYLTLYYLFPLASCACIGLAIGDAIVSRWRYPAAFLIWAIVSPISPEVVAYIFTALRTSNPLMHYFFTLFGLSSVLNISTAPIYGDAVETIRFMLSVAKWAMYLLLVSLLLFARRGWTKAGILAGFLTVFIGAILLSYNENTERFFIYYDYQDTKSHAYEIDFYHARVNEPTVYSEGSDEIYMEPVHCRVELSPGLMSAAIRCRMEMVCERTTDAQAFTLYRGFEVQDVRSSHGCEFEQVDDYVFVRFQEQIGTGEEVWLEFDYEGVSSPMYPANRDCISLDGSYPWLPDVGATMQLKYDGDTGAYTYVLRSANRRGAQVEYELLLSPAPKGAVSNLPQTGAGRYAGVSDCGVYLFYDPMMKTDVVDGTKLSYSPTVSRLKEQVVEYVNGVYELKKELFELLELELPEPVERIIMPPTATYTDYHSEIVVPVGNGTYLFYSDNVTLLSGALSDEGWNSALVRSVCNSLRSIPGYVSMENDSPAYKMLSMAFEDSLRSWKNMNSRPGARFEMLWSPKIEYFEQMGRAEGLAEGYEALKKLLTSRSFDELKPLWRMWYDCAVEEDGRAMEKIEQWIKEALKDE